MIKRFKSSMYSNKNVKRPQWLFIKPRMNLKSKCRSCIAWDHNYDRHCKLLPIAVKPSNLWINKWWSKTSQSRVKKAITKLWKISICSSGGSPESIKQPHQGKNNSEKIAIKHKWSTSLRQHVTSNREILAIIEVHCSPLRRQEAVVRPFLSKSRMKRKTCSSNNKLAGVARSRTSRPGKRARKSSINLQTVNTSSLIPSTIAGSRRSLPRTCQLLWSLQKAPQKYANRRSSQSRIWSGRPCLSLSRWCWIRNRFRYRPSSKNTTCESIARICQGRTKNQPTVTDK